MKTTMKKHYTLQIDNQFHNTGLTLHVRRDGDPIAISRNQHRRMHRVLCGRDGCTCEDLWRYRLNEIPTSLHLNPIGGGERLEICLP